MSTRVFLPRKKLRGPPPKQRAAAARKCGSAGPVTVQVDPALGAQGQQLAQAILATAAADYQRVAALFASVTAPPVIVSIDQLSPGSDGTGGAWHTTCSDATLHADACFDNPQRTAALWIAEFVEVLSAVQAAGWDCGNTNGEGLSRVIAEWSYPGALDDYETASLWLDSQRPNWVDNQVGSDTDDLSNGCSTLFLWWLVSLGYDLSEIAGAGDSNLAGTYAQLHGGSDAWDVFSAAVEAQWPAGQPSGVSTDNPWAGGTPTPPPPSPPPPAEAATVTISATVPAGDYLLVPVAELRERMGAAGLSAEQLVTLLEDMGALLLRLVASKAADKSTQEATPAASRGARVLKDARRQR